MSGANKLRKSPGLSKKKRKANMSLPGEPVLSRTEVSFIREYCFDQNGSRAYKAAMGKPSMSSDVARAAASRMLARVNVKAQIVKTLTAMELKEYTSTEFVITGLGRLAKGNIGNFVVVQEDGTVKTDFTGISKDDFYQLSELVIEDHYEPSATLGGEPTHVQKVKFKVADRRAAHNDLARLGDLKERCRQSVLEHVAKILRDLRDNLISAREAAYEFHIIGHPLPEALKIELLKIELAPPSTGESITDEELERRYQAALAEGERQRAVFVPERRQIVQEIKDSLKEEDFFKEGD